MLGRKPWLRTMGIEERQFMRLVFLTAATLQVLLGGLLAGAEGPYQATGFKVGEVTDQSAIVWTRLTRHRERNPADGPMVEIKYRAGRGDGRGRQVEAVVFPAGVTVAGLRDAVPGARGEVRVLYRPMGAAGWERTPWQAVEPARDYTRQFRLQQLPPDTQHEIRVECRPGPEAPVSHYLDGQFRTAPRAGDAARVVFAVSTGQAYNDRDSPDGFEIYRSMPRLAPAFFVHTGDIVYYDSLAKTPELARYHWQRTYSLPTNVEFHRQVASYFIKDDHDTWMNDCWPGMETRFMHQFTFEQGQEIFLEQVPMDRRTYRTARWGKDLQIWLVEGRDFRSPNTLPDGPDKTIWGPEQKAWFKETVQLSDATFRVLISPTPLVGPDRANKHDNHANKDFQHEGEELRAFIASQKNMAVVCGDRHWQYLSIHPQAGVREYSCGPASDRHAGGWSQSDLVPEYHRFLKVAGGFLSGTVERVDDTPALTFRFHAVDGSVRFEDRLMAE